MIFFSGSSFYLSIRDTGCKPLNTTDNFSEICKIIIIDNTSSRECSGSAFQYQLFLITKFRFALLACFFYLLFLDKTNLPVTKLCLILKNLVPIYNPFQTLNRLVFSMASLCHPRLRTFSLSKGAVPNAPPALSRVSERSLIPDTVTATW